MPHSQTGRLTGLSGEGAKPVKSPTSTFTPLLGEGSSGVSYRRGDSDTSEQSLEPFSRNPSFSNTSTRFEFSLRHLPTERVCYPKVIPTALERAREILRLAESEAERIRTDGERNAVEARGEALEEAKKELERWKSLFFSSTLNFLHEAISVVCREVVGEELLHSETALRARITRALALLPNGEEFVLYIHEREKMSTSPFELLPQSTVRIESDPTLSPERARLEAESFTVTLEPIHHLEGILTSLKELLGHETSPT